MAIHKIESYPLLEHKNYVKIHGLQRTATNYAASLINNNFCDTEALVNIGGWKHGYYCAPWTLGQEVHVLVVTKNPYAWLVSLYNFWGPKRGQSGGPDLRNVSFDQFVRNRVIFEEQAGTPFLYLASNPVQHWNSMNFHWMSIQMNVKRVCILPYEALLNNYSAVLDSIGEMFGLKKTEHTKDCSSVLIPSNERPVESLAPFDKSYYINKEYLKSFTPELIQFVNDQLDKQVMHDLGYEFMEVK